jgi:hypothetical protein
MDPNSTVLRTYPLSIAHDGYIHEHNAEKGNPSLAAGEVGMSLSGFERAFKQKICKQTPHF